MPVFLFAVSQVKVVDWQKVLFSFLVLHLLVYPASNGYNSYMDRDNTPIGGLAKPMQPTRQLFRISVLMDVLAVILSLFINYVFALGILFYILASRTYSYRRIRLKKYPLPGFVTVFIFQGAAIFFSVYYACSANADVAVPATACLISSLLIGATTISYLLGTKGSFVFSGLQFLTATLLLYFYFSDKDEMKNFFLFLGYTFPVVLFFCYWMFKVWRNNSEANFKNSLIMNIVAMFCTACYFASLIYIRHFE